MTYNRNNCQKKPGKAMVLMLSLLAVLVFTPVSADITSGSADVAGSDTIFSLPDTAIITATDFTPGIPDEEAEFRAAARKNNIPFKSTTAFKTLYNGYYLVAGVFGNAANAEYFVKSLQGREIDARSALHPETGMHYIYLAQTTLWKEAITLTTSGLHGAYAGKLWIMEVKDSKVAYPAPEKKLAAADKSQKPLFPHISFSEAAARHGIATRTDKPFPPARNGYYIIAGVFSSRHNADSFSNLLGTRKLSPEVLSNPENHKNLVSLGYYPHWEEALQNGISGLNGRYKDEIWILEIKGPEAHDFLVNSENTIKKASLGKGPSDKDPPEITKLLEKADSYFHKMWYAEAAELYEMVLEKTESPSADIIQKAGDSHYFNTNMQRAYYWYDQLYDLYKNDMSAENLFKYAHTLKGTGRYGRAKRLMKLYNRKMEKTGVDSQDVTSLEAPPEAVLDNILQKEQNVEIKNLSINSRYSEFAPMFLGSDEIVYSSSVDSAFFHTRRYKWNNQPYLDLYVAKMNEETQEVRDAVKFSRKVNTKYHEAVVTFSPDNETMYFTRNNFSKKLKRDKKGVNNLKIYKSVKIDGEWTEAVELPFNSDEYSTGHPALSPDGKQLYFVSDMPGSLGETDIFVVDVLDDGSYSEPRNLGPEINTSHKEMFPFINNKKLYFSSDGHVGLGGLDIYEVAFDDAAGFLEVHNLGKPVNSNMDDFSYIVNEDTQKGYFASNRKGGKGDDDIYSFHRLFPEEVNNNAIAGVVTDVVSGTVIPQALVTLLDENNMKLKEMMTGDDGAFAFEDLEGTTKYSLKTTRPGYFKSEQQVVTLNNEKVSVDVALQRLDERIVVEAGISKLKTDMIYFDFDKSYIRKDAAAELDKLIEVMNEYGDMVIRIESHTDSRGPAAYNKYLSDKRAKASREYLIHNGIAPERIESAIGYGEERLLNGCDGSIRCSNAQHQLNRRSEFIIVSM